MKIALADSLRARRQKQSLTQVQLGDTAPIADSSATNENGYKTTITHSFISGCGLDSVAVLLNGETLGFAPIRVKSPDFDASGDVDLVDLTVFSYAFAEAHNCPDEEGYNDCANFFTGPADPCVGLLDLVVMSLHYLDAFPGQGGPQQAPAIVPGATISVTFDLHEATTEQGARQNEFSVTISLDNASDVTLLGMVV